jgi:hypothetical protein
MSLALLFHHLLLNIFRILVHQSSQACDLLWIYFMDSTHMVVPNDDGPRYARDMYRLKKYTKNKLCIKLVLLYTFTSIFF